MIQNQPSPRFFQQPSNSLAQSSLFRHYLPPKDASKDLSLSREQSILCTPENYMLVLSYSNSLESQIAQLRQHIVGLDNQINHLTIENTKLSVTIKQFQQEKIAYCRKSFGIGIIQPSTQSLTYSFEMVNKNNSNSQRDFKKIYKDDLTLYMERQIIDILKQENRQLSKKLNQIYKENQDLISQKWNKYSRKRAQIINSYSQQNEVTLPFEKIKIKRSENAKQKQNQENVFIRINKQNSNREGFQSFADNYLPYHELNAKINNLHSSRLQSFPSSVQQEIQPTLIKFRSMQYLPAPNFNKKSPQEPEQAFTRLSFKN